jgi:hypothetical protein
MYMRKISLVFAFVLLMVAIPVLAADLTGKWDLKFTGPMGPEVWNLTVTMKDQDTFSAKGTHPFLGAYDGKGVLKGNEMEITFVLQGGKYTRVFTGTLDGDKAAGKVTLDKKPESNFTMAKK